MAGSIRQRGVPRPLFSARLASRYTGIAGLGIYHVGGWLHGLCMARNEVLGAQVVRIR